MLEDFHQDRDEHSLDPIPEAKPLAWNKQVVLFCMAIAFIGFFIFFTSDSWTSSEGSSQNDSLLKEIQNLKERVAQLEQKRQAEAAPAQPIVSQAEKPEAPTSLASLKSLIEQELQETVSSVPEPQQPARPAKKETKTYTVKKGDSLSGISQKVYGTSKRWKHIVEANKEILGNNHMLKPGMTLVIPEAA